MKALSPKILLFITASVLTQSCHILNTNETLYDIGISYQFIHKNEGGETQIIKLFNDGGFMYCETNYEILGDVCMQDNGEWYKVGDTIFLTTFFQNSINDYIKEIGNTTFEDSVFISIYSIKSENPSNDFAFLDHNNCLIYPNSNGNLVIPCSEKDNLARQLLIGLDCSNEMNLTLECGKIYKYYIKDCFHTVMSHKSFFLTDSSLIDIETMDEFIRMAES